MGIPRHPLGFAAYAKVKVERLMPFLYFAPGLTQYLYEFIFFFMYIFAETPFVRMYTHCINFSVYILLRF